MVRAPLTKCKTEILHKVAGLGCGTQELSEASQVRSKRAFGFCGEDEPKVLGVSVAYPRKVCSPVVLYTFNISEAPRYLKGTLKLANLFE
jgi:hypothetical protein